MSTEKTDENTPETTETVEMAEEASETHKKEMLQPDMSLSTGIPQSRQDDQFQV